MSDRERLREEEADSTLVRAYYLEASATRTGELGPGQEVWLTRTQYLQERAQRCGCRQCRMAAGPEEKHATEPEVSR